MTIPNNNMDEPNTLNWRDIHAAKFSFDSPFQIKMSDGGIFYADSVVRLIPKRRAVVFGMWHDKPVVAKLFFHPRHARRNMEKDAAGVTTLLDYKIPTPSVLYQGMSEDKRIYVLIFEQIFESQNLEEIWRQKSSIEDLYPTLKSVVVELATHHVLGVLQHDLHLKNFLLTEKKIYTLDGAQVELFPKLLAKKPSISNLSLFLSQFGVGVEEYQEKLFRFYAKSRGWILKSEDLNDLFFTIKKWNDLRWKRFEKKILRECTDFSVINEWRHFGVYNRHYASPEFKEFLKNPDSVFSHPSAKILKAGHSSTVIRVTLDDRDMVVKRYNMKNLWHRLRRCMRATRASLSWRLAQKLSLFGIRTAKPIAFVENKLMGFRGKSYFVSEYISGEHIGEYFTRQRGKEEDVMMMVDRVITLLKNIAKLEITHGDLKMTNILVDAHDEPVIIDLDGAIEHESLAGLRSAWRKEIVRFMSNFDDQPSVREKFRAQLRKN